jgi:ADP-heptose:LPS heptosyltransferase
MGKHWTIQEVDTLRKMYADNKHIDIIAATIGRSRSQIYSKTKNIGLKRPYEFRRLFCPYPLSTATRFKKGMTAWNKGMKLGSDYGGKETQFKKGMTPHNKLPEELKETIQLLRKIKRKL